MTASTASDASGGVEYQFQCVAGGAGCINSGWQSSPSYLATGLAAATPYSFSVTARDLSGNTTAASAVASAVTAANQPPLAVGNSATLNEDATVSLSVLSNDSDPDGDSLSISSTGLAAHGTLSHNGSSVTYKPNANYNGSDSFSYSISDGFGGTATAMVAVTVNAVNDAPVAVADTAAVVIGRTVIINVLSNDSDVDKDSLTLASLSSPGKGTAAINGTTVIYTAGSKTGTDTFSYTIGDGHGGTATAAVSVAIKRR